MKKSIYFILIFFFSFQISVFAWSTDPSSPVVICDASENQTGAKIVKLSDGNFIILWVDERRGDVPGFSWKYKDIYGQKLNPDGEIQWTENGISIVEGSGEGVTYELQTDVRAVSDEAGGIIFSWTDASGGGIQNNNVRINKLDGSGSKLWGGGGILLQDGDSGSNVDLCVDGEGGVFAVWEYGGYRLWYPRGKASHIGNDGSVLTNYGSISSQGGDDGEGSAIANPMVIYSGTGEAIIGWEDSRDGPYYGWRSLRVQKFSSPDTGTVSVEFESGDILTLVWSWGLPEKCAADSIHDAIGPEGILKFAGETDEKHKWFILKKAGGKTEKIGKTPVDSLMQGFKKQMEHFIDCIKNNKKPEIGYIEGKKSLEIGLKALKKY